MEIAGKEDVAPVQSAEDKPSEPVGSGLALQGFDLESWSAADGDALDVGSLVTFNVPNLKVTEVLGAETAGGVRRSKVLLDLQSNVSNLSSRSESPLSMDSSRSQTPTGTLTRAERQNELWKAIGCIDTFLLDKDIVEACKSMANDLCWEDELTETPNVSFAEFLQQYRELTDWLNQVHKVTEREVTSLSEKYLNQSYHEEMLERSPRREFLNSYSHQLLLRYPHMADQISARMNRLNAQWSVLEHNVAPKYGKQDTDTMLSDLDSDLKTLRRWLDAVEAQLLPLTISADWTRAELEDRLQQHQVLQREIESHNKIVNAVRKLSERLERQCGDQQRVALNLERRWHGVWLQSLEWQCRLEEAISRPQGSTRASLDFEGFSLPVLDESLLGRSAHDLSSQHLIELEDDSLLFIGHRDDYSDSTCTSTDDESRSFDLSSQRRPRLAAEDLTECGQAISDQFVACLEDSLPSQPSSPSRSPAAFKGDSPLGKRPFPDLTSGEASPAKKGSQSLDSKAGLSSVVLEERRGSPAVPSQNSSISPRSLCVHSYNDLLLQSLYEGNGYEFLKTHKSVFDRSSGDSANISETESKMGDSPPVQHLLAAGPAHLAGYAITSSEGEEDPLIAAGRKTEVQDIGYSSESQSNDEGEIIHHQIDMEYKFPGKCEVASDGPLGDKVLLPSVAIRSDYYCMTLVDIDSTDKTDTGDTTDSGTEKLIAKSVMTKSLETSKTVHSRTLELSDSSDTRVSGGGFADLKLLQDIDSDDLSEITKISSPVSLMELKSRTKAGLDTSSPVLEFGCDGLTSLDELLECSESDSAPESTKKSIRYLIEHAEDLVKPQAPKVSNQVSPCKQTHTLISPSKQTQTDSYSTVESSCDASGEDNSECEGHKGFSHGEGFSTTTDDADETLFNSTIHLEAAADSTRHINLTEVLFPPSNSPHTYDLLRLRKQTGGNPKLKGRKDRPWSVVGLESADMSKHLDRIQPVAASESAIDNLHFSTDTDSPAPSSRLAHFSTFPRDSHSGHFHRAVSSCDNSLPAASSKRQLKYSQSLTCQAVGVISPVTQLDDPELSSSMAVSVTQSPGSENSSRLSPHRSRHLRHPRRRSSLEKKPFANAGSATYSSSTTDSYISAEADSESDTTDEYLTAAATDVDDVHNVSGSLSENSSWDNYQFQMVYPPVSEGTGEELLHWDPQDDLEFDEDFVLSGQPRSIVRDVMSSSQPRHKLTVNKRGAACEDSDSDLDDFHDILEQSERALKLACQSLRKKRKNPMGTGLHPKPTKYEEIIKTFKTNKHCLENICQFLKTEDVPDQDVKRIQDLMTKWQTLYSQASERFVQSTFLNHLSDNMAAMRRQLREGQDYLSYDRFRSAQELDQTIHLLKDKEKVLAALGLQLVDMQQGLLDFSCQNPAVCVSAYTQDLSSLQTSLSVMCSKVSEHTRQLQNNELVWLDYLASQQELDTFLATERERLHRVLSQQEYGMRVTKKDALKELEIMQTNLKLYESKLATLQSTWANLTQASDQSAQQLLLASLADLRNQLFVLSERCREMCQNLEDGANLELDQQADFHKLALSARALQEVFQKPDSQESELSDESQVVQQCPAGWPLTRTCARWLRSLPFQVVALMLLTGLVCALDPDILKHLTDLTLTISPQLSYVNGPPAI